MTVGDLQTLVLQRLGEDASKPVYYTGAEVLSALNEAQRIMVLLTLCLERTETFPLSVGTAFYRPRTVLSDWLLPLRVRLSGGARLRPARLEDLDALDSGWQARPGYPDRYCSLGFNLLAINRQPEGPASLVVTYAKTPTKLQGVAETPEVPTEYHQALADYAINRLRMKEGGQEFTKTTPYGDRFLADCRKLGEFVRARNVAQGYDLLPFELSRYDVSAAGRKQQNG